MPSLDLRHVRLPHRPAFLDANLRGHLALGQPQFLAPRADHACEVVRKSALPRPPGRLYWFHHISLPLPLIPFPKRRRSTHALTPPRADGRGSPAPHRRQPAARPPPPEAFPARTAPAPRSTPTGPPLPAPPPLSTLRAAPPSTSSPISHQ